MKDSIRTTSIILILAITAAITWSLTMHKVIDVAYNLIGSPQEPTISLWVLIVGLSFLHGGIWSFFIAKVTNINIIPYIFLFLITVAVITLGIAFIFNGTDAIAYQVKSVGFWSLLIGIIVSGLIGKIVWAMGVE